MQVRRLIHIFNGTDEIVSVNGWEIKCHPQSKIENYLSILDLKDSTDMKSKYSSSSDKDEFYKYCVLYQEGGIFARYNKIEEIPLDQINILVQYCENRQISLLQCPSLMLLGFIHHPQLMSMLTESAFHPLSSLYKNRQDSFGHKTLVTSLPLKSYLDKIKGSDGYSSEILFGSLIVTSVVSFFVGVIWGGRKITSIDT